MGRGNVGGGAGMETDTYLFPMYLWLYIHMTSAHRTYLGTWVLVCIMARYLVVYLEYQYLTTYHNAHELYVSSYKC